MGNAGRAPSLHYLLYPSIFLTAEKESQTNLSHGNQKVPDYAALGTIRLIDLVAVLWVTLTGLLAIIILGLCLR
jgi:hypothetical protein